MDTIFYCILLTLVLLTDNVEAQDFIAFIPDTEFIFENRTDNCVTLMRAGSANGNITVSYTLGGIGITSPDDFVAGDFQIVYPAASSTLKINVTFNDNTVCDTGTRLLNVTLTSLDRGSLIATPLSKFFQVLDDDGEWTEWTNVLGVCDCSTNIQQRTRNRTCDDKGQSFRACDGDSILLDTVDYSDDPSCTLPDFIAFIPEMEFIFENRTDNCVTLMRAGSANGDITVSYTLGGIGITSPDDFVAGDFQIVYPAASSTLKINVTFNDNTVCDTGARLLNVTLTSLDRGSLIATPLSKFFQVLDDDGEWTEWTTVLGVCDCSASTQPRTRNRTCDDKGQSFRTCVGDSFVMDSVDCSADPICTSTTTLLPETTSVLTTLTPAEASTTVSPPMPPPTTTMTSPSTPTTTTSTTSIPTTTASLTTTTKPSTPLPTTTTTLQTTTTAFLTMATASTPTLTTTQTSPPTTTSTLTTTTTSTSTTTPALTTSTTSGPTSTSSVTTTSMPSTTPLPTTTTTLQTTTTGFFTTTAGSTSTATTTPTLTTTTTSSPTTAPPLTTTTIPPATQFSTTTALPTTTASSTSPPTTLTTTATSTPTSTPSLATTTTSTPSIPSPASLLTAPTTIQTTTTGLFTRTEASTSTPTTTVILTTSTTSVPTTTPTLTTTTSIPSTTPLPVTTALPTTTASLSGPTTTSSFTTTPSQTLPTVTFIPTITPLQTTAALLNTTATSTSTPPTTVTSLTTTIFVPTTTPSLSTTPSISTSPWSTWAAPKPWTAWTAPTPWTAWTPPTPWTSWTAPASWADWSAPTPWTAWTAPVPRCYGPWGCWEPGTCSVTCGEGVRVEKRTRELLDCATSECDGPLEEQRQTACNKGECDEDTDVGEWTTWVGVSPCSATCSGYVTQNRHRACTVPGGCSWDLIQSRQMLCSQPCW